MDKKNSIHYKPAAIYYGKGDIKKPWFVYFSWRRTVNDQFERIKVFADLNKKFKDAASRMAAAKILQQTINEALASGWNPYSDKITESRSVIVHKADKVLIDAMTNKTASLKPRTASTYKSRLKLFLQWMQDNKLSHLYIQEIQPIHIEQYQVYLLNQKLNHVTINNNIEIISSLFKKLKKLKIIADNPCEGIDYLKETESSVFMPYTDEELQRIVTVLKEKHPELFLFFLLIYYCYLRPETIVALKGHSFDFKRKVIYVEGEDHKNRKRAEKQMLTPLHDYLKQRGIDKINADWFVFSKDLLPGIIAIKPVRASELWKQIIIDGEGINKKLYAAKHTGGGHYVNDNTGMENMLWLQKQMSHHSLEQTEVYIRKSRKTQLDETKAKIRKL